jgi:hypothetical protein
MSDPTQLKDEIIKLLANYGLRSVIKVLKTEIRERPQWADPKTGKIYNERPPRKPERPIDDADLLCSKCRFPLRYHSRGVCPAVQE